MQLHLLPSFGKEYLDRKVLDMDTVCTKLNHIILNLRKIKLLSTFTSTTIKLPVALQCFFVLMLLN